MKKIVLSVVIVWLSACQSGVEQQVEATRNYKTVSMGPVTVQVERAAFSKVYYVSLLAGEGGDGSQEKPFKTLSEAVNQPAGNENTAILVASGEYEENGLRIKKGFRLFGGYSPDFKERDIDKFMTTVNGMKKGRIFTLSENTGVDGFRIRKGQIRGKGAAVFTTAKNIVLSNNVFWGNKTLKPVPWNPAFWHETANDGGAIYCADGAEMTIVNNLFLRNETENGRGGAIAADNDCTLSIENNVFFQNTAGLDDPMRSSDGGAVSIFRWSDATVVNNWCISNAALHKNDGGGIWIALWSSATVKDNIFAGNEAADDAGAIFVGGQEHRYDAPLDPIPPKDKFFVTISGNTIIGNRNPSFNSGAMRFTMEGRGEFTGNVTAFNNGIYFQRSEVLIEKNSILDDFLLVETKEGLTPCVVKDNVIWAGYSQGEDINPEIRNNNMLYPTEGNGNYSVPPDFIDDGLTPEIASVNYQSRELVTTFIFFNKNFEENELVGRVVNIGGRWSVIRSNEKNMLEVWGDFAGETALKIIPTYTLNKNR